jgi:metal-responsive CopG/Arc/MetJ family transcriptional regulator
MELMKVAISIPDPVFKAGEGMARELKLSRSELYARALSAYLGSRGAYAVTAKLNEIYGGESSAVDAALSAAQTRLLKDEAW